jgi:hypothetical protein
MSRKPALKPTRPKTVLGQDPPRRMCHVGHAVKPLDAWNEAEEKPKDMTATAIRTPLLWCP